MYLNLAVKSGCDVSKIESLCARIEKLVSKLSNMRWMKNAAKV